MMKKVTAAVTLLALAALPSTAAWAGGNPSSKGSAASTSTIEGEAGQSGDRIVAEGCYQGHSFWVHQWPGGPYLYGGRSEACEGTWINFWD